MPVDKFGRMSDTKTKDTGVSLTYINNNYVRSDGGTALSGSIDMRGNTLYNVADPVNPQDVVTKVYVDNIKGSGGGGSPFYKENDEYKTTHRVNMMFNKLVNLHKPIESYDAATKNYVDYIAKEIREKFEREIKTKLEKEMMEKLEKRSQLIAVHARYCGPLKKGEYPFKFRGNSLEICEEIIRKDIRLKGLISGFVMPHSGRIRKIICESLTFINLDKMVNELINSLRKSHIDELKKHFGKEDFKKDLLKKNVNNVDFSTYKKYEGKTFFKIVKFKKNFFEIGAPYKPLLESLLSVSGSVVIEKFKWIEIELSRINGIRAIMKILNHDNIPLKEGETINIEISDFQQPRHLFFLEGDLMENILQTAVYLVV